MKTIIDLKNNKYLIALIATWGVSLLVLVACYFIFHLPKKEMLANIRGQYDESNDLALIANKATQQDIRGQIKQRFEEAGQTVTRFSVSQDDVTGLVFEIGKIANELGLSEFASKNQKAQKFSTLGESPEVTETWLKVEFESSFLKFVQFVNRLERQSPTVFVEQMTLRRNDDGRQEIEVNLELSFLVTQNQNNSVAVADASTN